jgi:hypothetical protein
VVVGALIAGLLILALLLETISSSPKAPETESLEPTPATTTVPQ